MGGRLLHKSMMFEWFIAPFPSIGLCTASSEDKKKAKIIIRDATPFFHFLYSFSCD